MSLGERIAEYRTKQHMSQNDLADALDVSRQSVSKWETDASVPELEKLVQLCDIFGVSMDVLVRGKEGAPEYIDNGTVDKEPNDGCRNGKAGIYTGAYGIEKRKIAGTILLCMAFTVMMLIGAISRDFLAAMCMAVPFVACGVVCFCFQRRVGLKCAWTIYFMAELVLRFATSIQPGYILTVIEGYGEPYIVFWFALLEQLLKVVLIICTVWSYRNIEITMNQRVKSLLKTGWADLIILCAGLFFMRYQSPRWYLVYVLLRDWAAFTFLAVLLVFTYNVWIQNKEISR